MLVPKTGEIVFPEQIEQKVNGFSKELKVALFKCDTVEDQSLKPNVDYIADTRAEPDDIVITGSKQAKKRKRTIPSVKSEFGFKSKRKKDSDVKIVKETGPTTEGLYKMMQRTIERAKGKLRGETTAVTVANQQRQQRRQKDRETQCSSSSNQQQFQQHVQQQLQQQQASSSSSSRKQYRKRGPITCPVCHITEVSQKALISHISANHPGYRYPCEFCDRQFYSFNTMYKHRKEHDAPQFPCPGCPKQFHFQSELDRHKGIHNTVLPYACDYCPKRFASQKSLNRHLELHSGIGVHM